LRKWCRLVYYLERVVFIVVQIPGGMEKDFPGRWWKIEIFTVVV